MSLFGPAPLEPRGPQAALAAGAAHARGAEKQKPAIEANQRMRDAFEHRVPGAECDAAARKVADEHDDTRDRKRDQRRRRRDGREDSFERGITIDSTASQPHPTSAPPPDAPTQRHVDLRG